MIDTAVRKLFPATPLIVWQLRVSMAYEIKNGTVVHVGFGAFNDIVPAQISDLAATNVPYDPTFVGGIGGQVGESPLRPALPTARPMRGPMRTANFNRFSLRARRPAPDSQRALRFARSLSA